jgi:hypothetical protein
MADNIGYTPGSGATVAADEVGGVLYQRIKPTFGTDNSVPVDVSTNDPMPVRAFGAIPGTSVATDESIILLRRLIKLMESQSATDIGNRQRITLDSIPAGVTLPTVTTVTGVTTVTTVTTVTAANNLLALAGADQRQFIDVSRTNYNTGIRSKLTFS